MSPNENNYYLLMMEHLLWCTADDFSLDYFSNVKDENSIEQNRYGLQICVEFIYRCLKCNILKFNIGYQTISFANGFHIESLEEMATAISHRPLNASHSQIFNDELNSYIWIEEQVYGSDLLDQIAKDCNLVAYEDEVDFDDPRGRKFKEEIERVFAENGLPWDLKNPLFPIS